MGYRRAAILHNTHGRALLASALICLLLVGLTSCQHQDDSYGSMTEGMDYDSLPRTGLPVVVISTPNSTPVVSKDEYIDGAEITVWNADMTCQYHGTTKVRGRGNTTWTAYPKKPYALKLEKKQSLFGYSASKGWTLLADYCDKSMLRTAFMLEMSRACALKYTANYQYVELVVNGRYDGTYVLTEKIGRGKGRIEVETDGFIIEHDAYAHTEPLWFATQYGQMPYSVKYPSPNAGTGEGDDNYSYIRSYMNDLEHALFSADFADAAVGYRHYIDSRSFARWYILMELLGNVDPNRYYVVERRGAKLEMYPAWDAEWSLGLGWMEDWQWVRNQGEPMPADKPIHNASGYMGRLLKDPKFRAEVKAEWSAIRPRIPKALATLQGVRRSLHGAQALNFARWPVLGTYLSVETVTFGTWEEEADFVFDYFGQRLDWFDTYIDNL